MGETVSVICIMCGEEPVESDSTLCLTCNAKPPEDRILALYTHLERRKGVRPRLVAAGKAAKELKEKLGYPARSTVTTVPGKQVVVVRDPVTGDMALVKE